MNAVDYYRYVTTPGYLLRVGDELRAADGKSWLDPIADVLADHPHTDPGDGRTECDTCGKFVWLVTHSCKRVPVTAAARARHQTRMDPTPENAPQAEPFYPDDDCSDDESVGGDPGSGCAITPTCTLRCHIRHQQGESQLNDAIVDSATREA